MVRVGKAVDLDSSSFPVLACFFLFLFFSVLLESLAFIRASEGNLILREKKENA